MKTIYVIWMLLISLSVYCFEETAPKTENDNGKFEEFIIGYGINDTISNMIEGHPFIYYIRGHNGHIWSLVADNTDFYLVLSGDTRNGNFSIDTISHDNATLQWGIDSLSRDIQDLRSIDREGEWPIFTKLISFSAEGEELFECEEKTYFVGPHNREFNDNLKGLVYLMYWFAFPRDMRDILPPPPILKE